MIYDFATSLHDDTQTHACLIFAVAKSKRWTGFAMEWLGQMSR